MNTISAVRPPMPARLPSRETNVEASIEAPKDAYQPGLTVGLPLLDPSFQLALALGVSLSQQFAGGPGVHVSIAFGAEEFYLSGVLDLDRHESPLGIVGRMGDENLTATLEPLESGTYQWAAQVGEQEHTAKVKLEANALEIEGPEIAFRWEADGSLQSLGGFTASGVLEDSCYRATSSLSGGEMTTEATYGEERFEMAHTIRQNTVPGGFRIDIERPEQNTRATVTVRRT